MESKYFYLKRLLEKLKDSQQDNVSAIVAESDQMKVWVLKGRMQQMEDTINEVTEDLLEEEKTDDWTDSRIH